MPEVGLAVRKQSRAVADAAHLHYEVAGSGPAVVLIHSGITDSRSWDPQLDAFARHYQVVRYDMRGFGKSDLSHGEYSPRADLEAVMDASGTSRAALVGVSMGSALAIDFALDHPERVAALVLVCPSVSGRARSRELTELMAEVDRLGEDNGLDSAIERELEVWLYGRGRTAADVEQSVREAVFEMDRVNSARFPADMEARPITPPAIERLAELRVPTLIVAGDLDLADVFDAADRLEAGIPGARRAVMEGTAHVPNMEQPEKFNQIVLDFLRGVLRPPGTG